MKARRYFIPLLVLAIAITAFVATPLLRSYAAVLYMFEGNLGAGGLTIHTVALTEGQNITVHLDCPNAEIDPFVAVYDPSSSLLGYADDNGTNGCANGFSDAWVSFVAPASGNYTIEAYDYWGTSGAYRLTVSNDFGPSGRPIPDGYELRTITCSVDVFDMPGGNPVAGARIIGGQTWYVNPVPEKAADGSSWTEIYASGTIDGYIPTRCVG